MRIALLGPPASGKGTNAEMLVKRYRLDYICMGALLRDVAKSNDKDSMRIKGYLDRGQLVPDRDVYRLVKSKLNDNFVLDGFPRTLEQAKMLNKDTKLDAVLYIEVSEETIIDRITGRRQCSRCSAIYHIRNNPPKKEGICNACNGSLYTRDDDRKDVLEKRLEAYRQQTEPLIYHYKKNGLLMFIDGEKSIDVVFNSICNLIDSKIKPNRRI